MLDGSFVRGTTPTHIFPIPDPITLADLQDYTIAYRQKRKTILIKRKEDASYLKEIDSRTNIVMVLSQEETLLFDPRIPVVDVQIRASSIGSDVFVLGNYRLRLEDCFDPEPFDLEQSV